MRSPVAASRFFAAKAGALSPRSSAMFAWRAYSCEMPRDSRFSSVSAWSCAKSAKRRTAIAIETRPASARPARKSAGSRKRSERIKLPYDVAAVSRGCETL